MWKGLPADLRKIMPQANYYLHSNILSYYPCITSGNITLHLQDKDVLQRQILKLHQSKQYNCAFVPADKDSFRQKYTDLVLFVLICVFVLKLFVCFGVFIVFYLHLLL